MTKIAFAVDSLSVGYRRPDGSLNVVVWDVGFELRRGAVLGLAGESGCGKSTTALAAIGYQAPGSRILSGAARLGDVDLLALPLRRRRRFWGRHVAYVAQNAATALNPALPVGRQLAQPLVRHLRLGGRKLRDRQVELLDEVGLPDPAAALSLYPHQFSGGQQQRIALALTLACRPEVLILDEPTTGLDVTTQSRIAALLRTLVDATDVAALYVSHDLALLSGIADSLAVMYAGEIVERGEAGAVCVAPRHPYTQALLGAVPDPRAPRSLVGIPGRPPSSVVLDSCSFTARCPHAVAECSSGHVPLLEIGNARQVRCIRVAEVSTVRSAEPARIIAASGGPLLEVVDLECDYRAGRRSIAAVRGVSLTVAAGETLGIVGESGSGKSTLLRGIIGLHPPTAGKILLRGKELAPRAVKRPRTVRRELQIVFQNPDTSLNPRQTVMELVRRPIQLFRDDVDRAQRREAVGELLDAVKLPRTLLSRYPYELSGGQKQRVALARAFAARPSVLLCDEVTSALDVSVQATIIELILDLARNFGTAVIFVSHDLAVVRATAWRALVMRGGEVCEAGEVEKLFAAPSHPYTAELLDAIPELAGSGTPGVAPERRG